MIISMIYLWRNSFSWIGNTKKNLEFTMAILQWPFFRVIRSVPTVRAVSTTKTVPVGNPRPPPTPTTTPNTYYTRPCIAHQKRAISKQSKQKVARVGGSAPVHKVSSSWRGHPEMKISHFIVNLLPIRGPSLVNKLSSFFFVKLIFVIKYYIWNNLITIYLLAPIPNYAIKFDFQLEMNSR